MSGLRPRLGDEAGFTLVELLVACGASIVVLLALTALMTTTLHQTQRTFTEVDATRQARAVVATIDDELHSACVDAGAAPVQARSTADTLNFVSYTGDAASPGLTTTGGAANPILYHRVRLSAGTLTDATYLAEAANGAWTPGAHQGTVTLLRDATVQSGTDPFEYFSYKAFPAPDGNDYWTIPDGTDSLPGGTVPKPAPLSDTGSGLSSAKAQSTVEVVFNLTALAGEQNPGDPALAGTADPVSDAISLRLTTPPNEVAASAGSGDYGPCQ